MFGAIFYCYSINNTWTFLETTHVLMTNKKDINLSNLFISKDFFIGTIITLKSQSKAKYSIKFHLLMTEMDVKVFRIIHFLSAELSEIIYFYR